MMYSFPVQQLVRVGQAADLVFEYIVVEVVEEYRRVRYEGRGAPCACDNDMLAGESLAVSVCFSEGLCEDIRKCNQVAARLPAFPNPTLLGAWFVYPPVLCGHSATDGGVHFHGASDRS